MTDFTNNIIFFRVLWLIAFLICDRDCYDLLAALNLPTGVCNDNPRGTICIFSRVQ